ncbi:NAD(P)H-dependent glycerol-3-phosphate dehydrogenase [Amorphus orientalis]|uniref:Glycerol-3-phosphate dehydrogenase [NAD(P)+] n=1 Tax=Amorphus orientalis TaxID=649198 RepID=A0AAE4ASM1_9HYPH|nr:NAD(P)H-dependent glycerol-3-phosphate dehydrogenase [Amorphus orientalis]MDQ0315180.1 glycerol-3-phosphate dehydrogenase (NAD(P)+) [Amorphus orientalis]
MSESREIGVIGAGAWGTALALVLARAGGRVTLYARNPETVAAINAERTAPSLPGVAIEPGVEATGDLATAAGKELVILATPAQTTREVSTQAAAFIAPGTPLVITAKGIERATGRLLSDVVAETVPDARVAVLSGPGFAGEVARGLPTAVTIATADTALAPSLAEAFAAPGFRPYVSDDLRGVQIGGALKNVLAIAAGIVKGRDLGASAHAALVTRALAELIRLGDAEGARRETLTGLSGLGDLMLTSTNPQSRNFAFGEALGSGAARPSDAAAGGPLVEGAATAPIAVRLARDLGVDAPIMEAVAAVLAEKLTIDQAIDALLSRPLKREHD